MKIGNYEVEADASGELVIVGCFEDVHEDRGERVPVKIKTLPNGFSALFTALDHEETGVGLDIYDGLVSVLFWDIDEDTGQNRTQKKTFLTIDRVKERT